MQVPWDPEYDKPTEAWGEPQSGPRILSLLARPVINMRPRHDVWQKRVYALASALALVSIALKCEVRAALASAAYQQATAGLETEAHTGK